MKRVTDKEILLEARRIIESKSEDLICLAIEDSRYGTRKQKTLLRAWIMKMLGGYISYRQWLDHKHPTIFASEYAKDRRLTQQRLAWLDWMIENCDKSTAPAPQ